MTWWHRRGAVLALVGVWLVAGAVVRSDEAMPIEDLRMPLDHFESGRVRSQLRARTALVPQQGKAPITAEGVVVDFYTETGATNATVRAASCTYLRAEQKASSDGAVEMTHASAHITGKGFTWDKATEKIKILADVRVVLDLRSADAQKERLLERE